MAHIIKIMGFTFETDLISFLDARGMENQRGLWLAFVGLARNGSVNMRFAVMSEFSRTLV